jgi:spoIIIJ-associated protein
VSEVQVEGSGETVGEAKWNALRELEAIRPGLDKDAVHFQVVSEGERGLLGVGYTPARVVAVLAEDGLGEPVEDSALAADVRDLLTRITSEIGVDCRVDMREDEEALAAVCTGRDLGLLIGKHGQTIDAIQYLVNAIAMRSWPDARKEIVVDAAGYRARRKASLESLAVRSAERVVRSGEPVELEPMTAVERKVVHLRLKEFDGVGTTSEGTEPNRYVVISPSV